MQPLSLEAEAVEADRLATYPPPFPEGWYVAAKSEDLGAAPLQVRVAGNDMVLFRDQDGAARAIDAYCPHMGANLADGRVRDGCIECPFHNWRIDGSGCVVHIPKGLGPAPAQKTAAWSAIDHHGWVCVYHRHGEEASEPPYRPERLAAIDSGELRHRGDYDAGTIHMHLLEFVENAVDFQHFDPIHGELRIPWTAIPVPWMRIEHSATWSRDEREPHVSWFENEAQLAFRGKLIPKSGAKARVRLEGPGGIVRFDFRVAATGGRVVMFQSHTPTSPLTQRVRFRWFSDASVSRLQAGFIVGNWVSQWRQDLGIWSRKIYRKRPLLSRGDGPVHQLRRWYAQFYPASLER
jgi:cholesterol 7-dehydrogenase